jgi:hypothetical protein
MGYPTKLIYLQAFIMHPGAQGVHPAALTKWNNPREVFVTLPGWQ